MSFFLTVFSKDLYCRHVKTMACLEKGQYFSSTLKDIILESSKLKRFSDDKSNAVPIQGFVFEKMESIVGKGEKKKTGDTHCSLS